MRDKIYGFRRWLLIVPLVLMAGFCYSCSREHEPVSLQSYRTDEEILADQSTGRDISDTENGTWTADSPGQPAGQSATGEDGHPEGGAKVCYVHICGAVVNPGVYGLEEGQRIYHVVEKAGGYTQEAAADYLNLAALVGDGMKLIVPTREELLSKSEESLYGTASLPEEADAGKSGKINLNTATKEALMGLSGIGEAKAGDIIRYREEHGGFRKIEDIMKIPGIKEAAFQKIKDKVTV